MKPTSAKEPGYEVRHVYESADVDELLAQGRMNVHFEDMGNHFWGRLDFHDGRSLVLNFFPERRNGGRCVRMTVEENEVGGRAWGFKPPRKGGAA